MENSTAARQNATRRTCRRSTVGKGANQERRSSNEVGRRPTHHVPSHDKADGQGPWQRMWQRPQTRTRQRCSKQPTTNVRSICMLFVRPKPQNDLGKILFAIKHIEAKDNAHKTDSLTFTMYSDKETGYKKLPELTLTIGGQSVTFLVDTGATLSVLKSSALSKPPKKNGRQCRMVGAGDTPVMDPYTIGVV